MLKHQKSVTGWSIFLLFLIFSTAVSANEAASIGSHIDGVLEKVNGILGAVMFFDVLPGEGEFPLVVAWLAIGAIFLTVRMGFINFRLVGHAIRVLRGKYSKPDDKGDVTPFQALAAALSATVGLGNIAGVAIAIGIGGPGATFWMIVAGLFGMTAKFSEATLAQMYREVRPDGTIMGGAMEYLSRGFSDMGMTRTGKVLAILFSIMAIGGALGGGNAFQVNQALTAVGQEVPYLAQEPWIFGLVMATVVGIVIIGGIRRIAHVAEALVPAMIIIYVGAALWIVLANASQVPDVFALIFNSAFSMEAGFGGLVGAIVQGFKRAAFSSEAGIGSAAIIHSAAKTPYPARQGIVALMEPFIDTVVICTMTALVIIITGVYHVDGPHAELIASNQGAALTSVAFGTVISWFPTVLSISVVLFAFSTMISWSYYGERCWTYMFGERYSIVFKLIFVAVIVIGSVSNSSQVLDFSDLMLLGMAFPNMIGLYAMSGQIKGQLDEYVGKLRSGELDREVA